MDSFYGEITMFAGSFAPKGWAFCNGQLMPIAQNTVLFSIIGTKYGGDGKTTFALPNLQGAAPMHKGEGPGLTERIIGQSGGSKTVTLMAAELPVHTHPVNSAALGSGTTVEGTVWAKTPGRVGGAAYGGFTNPVRLDPGAVQSAGGSQPHNNMQPYLAVHFIICITGIFPPRG
ncbi:tail Collar domain-containing protein [Paenibacillus tyrfis]|uniref:phage tail protein n=1 Tax=Paenibacillus tyrfis TaxID=1501230 RepID=UPI0024900655|nr:tail fiber protein [Paenibacillus tyrfis]GLI10517.1 tail Collar domain-containing protein [Paenibacillus tyrfis]